MRRTLLLAGLFVLAVAAVGTAVASVDGGPQSTAPATAGPIVALAQEDPEVALAQDQRVGGPRDPFRPLIDEDDVLGGTTAPPGGSTSSTTSTTGVGGSTTSTSSTTSTTQVGGTSSTTGFVPGTVTVALKEIRTVNGILQATIEVDGINYIVSEGDTFAGDFALVTLFTDRAVLTFQGKTFELNVGEMILK